MYKIKKFHFTLKKKYINIIHILCKLLLIFIIFFVYRELNNNEISWTIEDKSGVFEGLANLIKLKLENNKIKSISSDAFLGLADLKVLSLSMNNITSIKDNALESMVTLQQL